MREMGRVRKAIPLIQVSELLNLIYVALSSVSSLCLRIVFSTLFAVLLLPLIYNFETKIINNTLNHLYMTERLNRNE